MPLMAAASKAGTAKWALATIDRVTNATHRALETQRPQRERRPAPKKTPRLRAGRAARVGGKLRAGGVMPGRVGRGSTALCMLSSDRNMGVIASMTLILRSVPVERGGRNPQPRRRIFCNSRPAKGAPRTPGGRPESPPFVL